jgi:hypothetical protein
VAATNLSASLHRPEMRIRQRDADRLQRLPDPVASRNFPNPEMAGAVLQDHDVAGEERTVRAAQVHKHAVMTGDRDHLHLGDPWRAAPIQRRIH